MSMALFFPCLFLFIFIVFKLNMSQLGIALCGCTSLLGHAESCAEPWLAMASAGLGTHHTVMSYLLKWMWPVILV